MDYPGFTDALRRLKGALFFQWALGAAIFAATLHLILGIKAVVELMPAVARKLAGWAKDAVVSLRGQYAVKLASAEAGDA